jgi:hypothetical protein
MIPRNPVRRIRRQKEMDWDELFSSGWLLLLLSAAADFGFPSSVALKYDREHRSSFLLLLLSQSEQSLSS